MLDVLLKIAATAAVLSVLAGLTFLVSKKLRLFRTDKATAQFRAIPDPSASNASLDKSESLSGPRLRETSSPAWAARKIDLVKPSTSIGRSIENDVVLVGDDVSSTHCRVDRDGSNFMLVDLGSRNKTWLNGVKVKKSPLRDGDQIRVGATTFLFERPAGS